MRQQTRFALAKKLTFVFAALFGCQALAQANLQITSPGSGGVFYPGQTIYVSFTADVSVTQIGLQVSVPNGWVPAVSSPGTFTFVIPANLPIQQYEMRLLGSSGGQPVFSNVVSFLIDTPQSIATVSVMPKSLQIQGIGKTGHLLVMGKLGDQTTANVTQSSQISFSSNDPTIATVNSNGLVTAVKAGSTFINVNGANVPYQEFVLVKAAQAPYPLFTPSGGAYPPGQLVTITSPQANSTIFYTTDGSTPTRKSLQYKSAIAVTKNLTLTAITTANSLTDSIPSVAKYTIEGPAATPTFNVAPGSYAAPQLVTISDGTAKAKIFYTLNGATPTESSTAYTAPIAINSTETLKAIAMAAGYTDSTVASGLYTISSIAPPVAAPSFSPAGGTYAGAQKVTLTEATAGASVYYTLDGSAPTVHSTKYTTPVSVGVSETIRAIAISTAGADSSIVSASYTIAPPSSCTLIDYSKGFSTAGMMLNNGATIEGSMLQLTDGKHSERRSAFYPTLVPSFSFSTAFTFQLLDPQADGFTFTLQNNSPKAVGVGGGGLGYEGIPNSAAIKFDLHNNAGEGIDSTGIYFGGVFPSTPAYNLAQNGIDLHSGHIFSVEISYNGSVVDMSITDTVTHAAMHLSQPQGDIPMNERSYAGFTAGTGGETAIQNILSWTYRSGNCSGH